MSNTHVHLRGVILKQAQFIVEDAYASAFRAEAYCYHEASKSLRKLNDAHVVARHLQLDSGAFFIRLLQRHHSETGDVDLLDAPSIRDAVRAVLGMWLNHSVDAGLLWSTHRPSGEECAHKYHIPSNFHVHGALDFVRQFARHWGDEAMRRDSERLQQEIWRGIHTLGVVDDAYVSETDGAGKYERSDDAHIPSLLSIPLVAGRYEERIYANTRRWVLSQQEATPMAMAVMGQALTAGDERERYELMATLVRSAQAETLMSESGSAGAYFAVMANCAEQFITGDVDGLVESQQSKHVGGVRSRGLGIVGSRYSGTFSEDAPKTLDFIEKCLPHKNYYYVRPHET